MEGQKTVCPFLGSFLMQRQEKNLIRPGEIEVEDHHYFCIEAKCKFWDQQHKDCLIKLFFQEGLTKKDS